MGDQTGISWCDHTWSGWIGCTKVSPACDGCYAAHLMDTRLGRVEWGPHGERSRTSADYWRQPLRWNRACAATGRRETVFPSLCDPFDKQADPAIRREWFGLIRDTPRLVWLLLTKRPQNIPKMVESVGFMPPNIAFGTTCEDRTRVEINLPHLMCAGELGPLFLFASFEPLLGDLGDLTPWLYGDTRLGWAITGGETSQGAHKARPSNPVWFREVRDQCTAAEVPFHHKQHGDWIGVPDLRNLPGGSGPGFGAFDHCAHDMEADAVLVGKARAGRLLDGVQHDGFPEVRA